MAQLGIHEVTYADTGSTVAFRASAAGVRTVDRSCARKASAPAQVYGTMGATS